MIGKDDFVNISNEIGIYNEHHMVIAVDTERMIRFINKYGMNYVDGYIGMSGTIRLEDYIDIMTSDQMRIFFSYKPEMVHKGQFENYPLMPITFRNYDKIIEILNTILECCDTHPQFVEWRKLFKSDIARLLRIQKRFALLYHILVLFDNHEKLSTRFFDLMRVKLIK